MNPLHHATSIGRKLSDPSGCQEVHHRLFTLFNGKALRDRHVPASASNPARLLSHRIPSCSLVVYLPAAVAKEVVPRQGHNPSTPPAFVVISVAEPF
jgi:hypothetical protein